MNNSFPFAVFRSPSITRDIQTLPEFIKLKNIVRDDLGHQIVEFKKHCYLEKKTLTGFILTPEYFSLLQVFCPELITNSSPYNMLYDIPIVKIDSNINNIGITFDENKKQILDKNY